MQGTDVASDSGVGSAVSGAGLRSGSGVEVGDDGGTNVGAGACAGAAGAVRVADTDAAGAVGAAAV